MNWKNSIILFKFPSRSRPQKFKEAMKSILDNLANPELARFAFTLDEDDPTKEQYNTVIDEFGKIDSCTSFGVSTSKIHAVNRDLEDILGVYNNADIIVCMSDDMRFIQNGFDNIIREAFAKHFAGGDGCLHFPDQNHGEACMTLNITDRKYSDRFGYIYHPSYESVECDLENQEVAQMLGRYKFMEEVRIFNHIHPSFSQCDYDDQYRKTEDTIVHDRDKANRRLRKQSNYDLIKTQTGWDTKPTIMEAEKTEESVSKELIPNLDQTNALAKKIMKKVAEIETLTDEMKTLGIFDVKITCSINPVKK